MKQKIATIFITLLVFSLLSAGTASAKPGGVCPPGQNNSGPGGSCVHNGGGTGNCGQNQGGGNGGHDNGYGNGTPCPNPSPSPTATTTTPVPNQGSGKNVGSGTLSCNLPEGPIAFLPATNVKYDWEANGQKFIVEALPGDAASNGLQIVDYGLCFDVQIQYPFAGKIYTYRVTDTQGNLIAIFESGGLTPHKP